MGDNYNTIWIGTPDGLFRFHDGILKIFAENEGLKHRRINSLLVDHASNIYVGTLGGGLYFYNSAIANDMAANAIQLLSGSDLLSANINSICALNDTVLLLGTDKGANRVNITKDAVPKVKSVYSYTNTNGFLNMECNPNAVLPDRDNTIWYGTKTGITVYDPNRERSYTQRPKVF